MRVLQSRTWAAVFALGLLAAPARATGPEAGGKLVVFPVEDRGSGLEAAQLDQLTEYLAAKLGEGGQFRIVHRADLAAVLQGRACAERDCQLEVGMQLKADFTLTTTLGRIGDICIFNTSLYGAGDSAALRTATERGSCEAGALLGALDVTALKLKARALPPSQGPVADARPMPMKPPGRPAPPAPAADGQPRRVTVGPSGQPLPEQPEPEAEPRQVPTPVIQPGAPGPPSPGQQPWGVAPGPSTAPPGAPVDAPIDPEWEPADPAAVSAPAGPKEARRFMVFGLTGSYPVLKQSGEADYTEPGGLWGARAAFEWLMGSYLAMGVGVTGLVGDGSASADLALRFGPTFEVADRIRLLLFADGGLSLWLPEEGDTLVGFQLGAGAAARWMMTRHFGLAGELRVAVQLIDDQSTDTSEPPTQVNLWLISGQLGVVVAW